MHKTRPTVLGLAPPKSGSAPAPTRSLTPTGRYRVNTPSFETVKPSKRTTYRVNPKCPNCGNRNPLKLESNGLPLSDPELTLLCTARVAPGADAFDGASNPPLEVGEDGKVACGMQWSPSEVAS